MDKGHCIRHPVFEDNQGPFFQLFLSFGNESSFKPEFEYNSNYKCQRSINKFMFVIYAYADKDDCVDPHEWTNEPETTASKFLL